MTDEEREVIQQIHREVEGPEPIKGSHIREWVASPSLQVRAAVISALRRYSEQIAPVLSDQEKFAVFENYYRDCLVQDIRDGDYVPNRYVAGYELANWFKTLWNDPFVPREHLSRIKGMLRDLYLANENLRVPIADAVLEHLFEITEVREFFSDWKSDPKLVEGFERAADWTRKDLTKLRN